MAKKRAKKDEEKLSKEQKKLIRQVIEQEVDKKVEEEMKAKCENCEEHQQMHSSSAESETANKQPANASAGRSQLSISRFLGIEGLSLFMPDSLASKFTLASIIIIIVLVIIAFIHWHGDWGALKPGLVDVPKGRVKKAINIMEKMDEPPISVYSLLDDFYKG